MIQMKVFTGTIAEITEAFNAWAASLVHGTQFPQGIAGMARLANDRDDWIKEIIYVLPVRPNSGIAVPTPAIARGNGRG
mgnify:CR=1 FL=1